MLKIEIDRREFLKTLSILSKVVPSRTVIPELTCCKCTLRNNQTLSCVASDLDTWVRYDTFVNVIQPSDKPEENEFLLEVKGAETLFKAITDDKVLFILDRSSGEATFEIRTNNAKYDLLSYDPENYPSDLDFDSPLSEIQIPLQRLMVGFKYLKGLNKGASNPSLEGVHLHKKGDEFRLIVTNGRVFGLFTYRDNAYTQSPDFRTAIPPQFFAPLNQKNDAILNLRLSQEASTFQGIFSNGYVITRVFGSPYFDYEQILPDETQYQIKLILNTGDLIRALKKIKAFVKKDTYDLITFDMINGQLQLTYEADRSKIKEIITDFSLEGSELTKFYIRFENLFKLINKLPKKSQIDFRVIDRLCYLHPDLGLQPNEDLIYLTLVEYPEE